MSRSRIGIAIVAIALLFAVAKAQDPPAATPAPRLVVGRYQLASVEHYIIFGNKAPQAGASGDRAVLRIDTATGNVDQWITGVDANGATYDRWIRTGQQ